MGESEGFLVGKRNGEARGREMEVWSGSPQEDVTQSNGRVRAWLMCGSVPRWVQWMAGQSEVPKPRFLVHTH